MSESRIAQVLERTNVPRGHGQGPPHQFRHAAAHTWLAAGGPELCTMRNFGWRSHTMLSRYGASVADERARDKLNG
jgi:integrase/recombinase XerC